MNKEEKRKKSPSFKKVWAGGKVPRSPWDNTAWAAAAEELAHSRADIQLEPMPRPDASEAPQGASIFTGPQELTGELAVQ